MDLTRFCNEILIESEKPLEALTWLFSRGHANFLVLTYFDFAFIIWRIQKLICLRKESRKWMFSYSILTYMSGRQGWGMQPVDSWLPHCDNCSCPEWRRLHCSWWNRRCQGWIRSHPSLLAHIHGVTGGWCSCRSLHKSHLIQCNVQF